MKRKLLKNFICLTICSSVIAGLFSVQFLQVKAVSQQTQEQIDKAEEEKEQLESELEVQEENKGHLQDKKESEEQKLNNLKKQYQEITTDLQKLEKEKTEKVAESEKSTENLNQAIEKQEKQYENMKRRIQFMYEKPEESLFGVLLKTFSIADLINRVDMTLKIQKYDRQQLEKYIKNTETIEKKKQELEVAHEELEGLIGETQDMQKQVTALQKQDSVTINNYLEQIAWAEVEIGDTEDAIEAKSKALQKLYQKAQEEEAAESRRQAEEAAKKLQEAIANGSIKAEDTGIVWGELSLTQAEMEMLTAMIYCESRGEPYEGQLAVGHVIMNRIRSSKFPNTLEEVLRAGKQFEPAGSGRFDIVLTAYREGIPGVISQREWESCQRAAIECVNGTSNVGECLFFRTHAPVPQLAENLQAAGVPYWIIQNHIFYYSWVNY